MDILNQLNSAPLYIISAVIIVLVAGFSLFSMIRAYRAGVQMGIDIKKLKTAITSSITFTILPSISILLGVIALAGTLGIPLPWLRLSVIGALHYETSVADIASKSSGLSGLVASEMTTTAFTTIALLMTVGIIWGCILMLFFGKTYSKKLLGKPRTPGKKSFAGEAMTALFIGLITAYVGSYIAECIQLQNGKLIYTGKYLQLVTLVFSALAMGVFTYFSEKKKMVWLENFSIAGSMLVGMAAAVICGLIV